MSSSTRPETTPSAAMLSSAWWMPWKKPATCVPPRSSAAGAKIIHQLSCLPGVVSASALTRVRRRTLQGRHAWQQLPEVVRAIGDHSNVVAACKIHSLHASALSERLPAGHTCTRPQQGERGTGRWEGISAACLPVCSEPQSAPGWAGAAAVRQHRRPRCLPPHAQGGSRWAG